MSVDTWCVEAARAETAQSCAILREIMREITEAFCEAFGIDPFTRDRIERGLRP